MKRLLGLILTFCLVLSFATGATAASKMEITKQPETATTNQKGTVSFSVGYKGSVSAITWYFVNPSTGEKITGKNLSKTIKGVKVSNPNKKKITLSKVPESMHGWQVYCHLSGNGYKIDSDTVTLWVYGMEIASPTDVEPTAEPAVEAEPTPEPETAASADSVPENTQPEQQPAESEATPNPFDDPDYVDPLAEIFGELENKTITITASADVLYKLDAAGNIPEGEMPVSVLEFNNTGSFAVKSAEPIKSWTVNGMRFEPSVPIDGFTVLNATEDLTLALTLARVTAASAEVDESRMCKVTCVGCTFTYFAKGLRSVTEGEVPAGAIINISGDNTDIVEHGYSINGADPDHKGLYSFRLTITEDTTIILE